MKQRKFKLKVTCWENGILKTITRFFASLKKAIKESKLWKGIVKIYNYLGQVLYCSSHDCDGYASDA